MAKLWIAKRKAVLKQPQVSKLKTDNNLYTTKM